MGKKNVPMFQGAFEFIKRSDHSQQLCGNPLWVWIVINP